MAISKYQDILRLYVKDVSNVKIAEVYGCSRTTVISAIRAFQRSELTGDQLASMSDIQLGKAPYPKKSEEKKHLPNVQKIERELGHHKHIILKGKFSTISYHCLFLYLNL